MPGCEHVWWLLVLAALLVSATEEDPIKQLQAITRSRNMKQPRLIAQNLRSKPRDLDNNTKKSRVVNKNVFKRARMLDTEPSIKHSSRADQFLQKVINKNKNPISKSDKTIRIKWKRLSKKEYANKQKTSSITSSDQMHTRKSKDMGRSVHAGSKERKYKANVEGSSVKTEKLNNELKHDLMKKVQKGVSENKYNSHLKTKQNKANDIVKLGMTSTAIKNNKISNEESPIKAVQNQRKYTPIPIDTPYRLDTKKNSNTISKSLPRSNTRIKSFKFEGREGKPFRTEGINNLDYVKDMKQGRSTFGFNMAEDNDMLDIPDFHDFVKFDSFRTDKTKLNVPKPIQPATKVNTNPLNPKSKSIPSYSAALKLHTYTDRYQPPTKSMDSLPVKYPHNLSHSKKLVRTNAVLPSHVPDPSNTNAYKPDNNYEPKPDYHYKLITSPRPNPGYEYEKENYRHNQVHDSGQEIYKISYKELSPKSIERPLKPQVEIYNQDKFFNHESYSHQKDSYDSNYNSVESIKTSGNPFLPSIPFTEVIHGHPPLAPNQTPYTNAAPTFTQSEHNVLHQDVQPFKSFNSFDTIKLENQEIYHKPKYDLRTYQETNPNLSKNYKIDLPSHTHIPKQKTSPIRISDFPGFPEDFSQPSFNSFKLPKLDMGESHFGLSDNFLSSLSWPGEQERRQGSHREGRFLDSDHSFLSDTQLGGQSGELGSYQWWSGHPVRSNIWSSSSRFHGA